MEKNEDRTCLYIYAHIPKCAGTTLTYHLEQNFPRDVLMPLYNYKFYNHAAGRFEKPGNYNAIHAHLCSLSPTIKGRIRFAYGHHAYYGTHAFFPQPVRYITFLRNPVPRVVSTYYQYRRRHQLNLPLGSWAGMPPNLPFDEWLDSGHPRISNHMTRFLCRQSDEDLRDPKPMNRTHLERAKQNLEQFFYVGITEKTTLDFSYLFDIFGVKKFFKGRNITPDRTVGVTLEVVDTISSKNMLDRELYEHARAINRQQRASLPGFWPRAGRTWFRRNVLSLREPSHIDFMG